MIMEELHRIHKDVPFGYWVFWVEPALRKLAAAWRALTTEKPGHAVTLR